MKKLLVFGLLLVLLCVLPLGALAQTALTFEKGQELLLFDQDGVKLTLNGKVEDNGMMSLQLGAVVENKTNKTIQVTFHGSCACVRFEGFGLPWGRGETSALC